MKYSVFIFILCFCEVMFSQTKIDTNTSVFVPNGFTIFNEVKGELNNDSLEDIVLMIKKIDSTNIKDDEYGIKKDYNRRGLIILLTTDNSFNLVLKNDTCFMSENESGGVYFAPELSLEIGKGNLNIQYFHGRYGNWKYTFKYIKTDFVCIGFDNLEANGPEIFKETSINFLTKKKEEKEFKKDTYREGYSYKGIVKEIKVPKLITLSEINAFEELSMSRY